MSYVMTLLVFPSVSLSLKRSLSLLATRMGRRDIRIRSEVLDKNSFERKLVCSESYRTYIPEIYWFGTVRGTLFPLRLPQFRCNDFRYPNYLTRDKCV